MSHYWSVLYARPYINQIILKSRPIVGAFIQTVHEWTKSKYWMAKRRNLRLEPVLDFDIVLCCLVFLQ